MQKKTIRLLMGMPDPQRAGGPPSHLPALADYFAGHPDYQVRTFLYGAASDRQLSHFSRVAHTIGTWFVFLGLLISFRPSVIHINTAFDKKTILRDTPFAITALILRKKLLFKFHGSLTEMIATRNIFWLALIKTIIAGADRIGVLSTPERDEFVGHLGHPEKFMVVRNIVYSRPDELFFSTASRDVASTPAALFASRLIPGKGLADVISAMPLILSELPGFTLEVAGDGPELIPMQQHAASLNVDKSVRWLGYIGKQELTFRLQNSQMLIFPSHLPEGMPMTLCEAMKSGVPPVTTPVRFALENLREPDNCLFIKPGDPAAMAAAVIRLAKDATLRRTIAGNNLQLIRQYSSEHVGASFNRIYREMLGHKSAGIR